MIGEQWLLTNHCLPITMIYLFILLSFLSGSLPFSVWVGQLALKKDIRQFGDGNPGGTNVVRAGGKTWGAAAILLDGLKGAIPVGIAYFGWQWEGWALTAVSIAPILGHAFSPFLRFKGGKALAVTFGVWTGLTLWVVPTVLGLFFAIALRWLKVEGRAVMVGMGGLLIFLLVWQAPSSWLWIWVGNALILAWKHRADFGSRQ